MGRFARFFRFGFICKKHAGTNQSLSTIDKKYAGRKVLIEQLHDGVWLIKTGEFIPDNEKWIHHPDISADLDSAIRWAEQHPPLETDIDALEEKLNS